MLDKPPFKQRPMPGSSQQTQAMPQGAGAVEEDIDSVPEEDAGQDEQAIYDTLMKTAYAAMADEKTFPMLADMIRNDPKSAIVDATLTIIEKVEQEHGPQNTDILQGVAEEVIESLADLAEEQGAVIEDAELEQIAATAIGSWVKQHPDRVDQQGLQSVGNAALQATKGAAPPQQAAPQGVTNGQPG